MTPYEVVKKLIGEIKPIGETNEDDRRFRNLQEMTELVRNLLLDIDNVSAYKDRIEYSLNKAGKFASEFFDECGIKD